MKANLTYFNIIKYIISIIILFICLYFASFLYDDDEEKVYEEVFKTSIIDNNELYTISVNYPRFSDKDKINRIISKYVFDYVKEFKNIEESNKSLNINYELFYFDNYVNVVFNISDSTKESFRHNILIDIESEKQTYFSKVYEEGYIKQKINMLSSSKYSSEISSIIEKSNIDEFTYIANESKIDVFFNNNNFKNISYMPNISIYLNDEEYVFEEKVFDESTKLIAFTFDDGPSEYTLEILKNLELNNSSATFFELGNKMKYNRDIVLEIYDSYSEVGSHTYSHKYLTKLSNEKINEEISLTSNIFNEITGGFINYMRPPYGSYNDNVTSVSEYPLILWSIDTKDWLHRNSDIVYNNIISNAKDGAIVLMHDTYVETLEAVKKAVPMLKSMGYEVVSISQLLKGKNIELSKGQILRKVDKKNG